MSAVPNAWGFSLFCDDIRHELGGKTTIVGIYQIDMIYPPEVVFPLVIPKFGIFVKYYETPGALKNDLNLRVYFPGLEKDKPVVDIPILRATLNPDAAPQYPLEDDQQRIFNLSFPVLLGPIPILQEGFIKVRMHCADEIIPLGSLKVGRMPPIETKPPQN